MFIERQDLCTAADAFDSWSKDSIISIGPKRPSYAARCQQLRHKRYLRAQNNLRHGEQIICKLCWQQANIPLGQQHRWKRRIALLTRSVGLHAAVVAAAMILGERFSTHPRTQSKQTSKLMLVDAVPHPAFVVEHEEPKNSMKVTEHSASVVSKQITGNQHFQRASPRLQRQATSSSPQPSTHVHSLDNFSLSNEPLERTPNTGKTKSDIGENNDGNTQNFAKEKQVGESDGSSGLPGEIGKSELNASKQRQGTAQGFVQARPRGGRIKPNYPAVLERRGITGSVELSVHVSATGEVKAVKVVRSAGYPEFDRAAIEAARRERWLPAQKNGQLVATWRSFRVNFGF